MSCKKFLSVLALAALLLLGTLQTTSADPCTATAGCPNGQYCFASTSGQTFCVIAGCDSFLTSVSWSFWYDGVWKSKTDMPSTLTLRTPLPKTCTKETAAVVSSLLIDPPPGSCNILSDSCTAPEDCWMRDNYLNETRCLKTACEPDSIDHFKVLYNNTWQEVSGKWTMQDLPLCVSDSPEAKLWEQANAALPTALVGGLSTRWVVGAVLSLAALVLAL